MATPDTTEPIRVCKIAGRYLVFDSDAATFLRHDANINGTLVGTAPQQPSQNIFLGLPIELRPEEAEALVHRNLAYVVDNVAAHHAVLHNPDSPARRAYLDSLKARKQTARKMFAEKDSMRASGATKRKSQARRTTPTIPTERADLVPSSEPGHSAGRLPPPPVKSLGVTFTSSGSLISEEARRTFASERLPAGHLCRFLLSSGYYMTPGLRFGSRYSVYPGDPLRFHAHFMANQYNWDEEIPILEVVTGGRLATAVKKASLIGGLQPPTESSPDGQVRTFSIEWAAM